MPYSNRAQPTSQQKEEEDVEEAKIIEKPLTLCRSHERESFAIFSFLYDMWMGLLCGKSKFIHVD